MRGLPCVALCKGVVGLLEIFMSNKYGLNENELEKIRARDKVCVYCRKNIIKPSSGNKRNDGATIEHLNFLPPWNNPNTVAICCWSCNSSRGKKKILDWFKTSYCIKRNINIETAARPVVEFINLYEKVDK